MNYTVILDFFFSSRRRHTRCGRDWSSDVCSSDLPIYECDFGKKNPVFSYPNDLPDQVKLWPSTPDKPGVNIYFSGYLAKNYSKIKNKREWLSGVIERENLPD